MGELLGIVEHFLRDDVLATGPDDAGRKPRAAYRAYVESLSPD